MKKTNLFFNAETIVAFHISGGDGNRKKISCLGEHKIGDFISDLYVPTDENGNEIDGEFTDGNGHGVGLTTSDVETGIGRIDLDGYYNMTYTYKLGSIEYDEEEAYAMVNYSDSFTREQAIMYFIEGETRESANAILGWLGVDPEEWFDDEEDC